MAIAQETGKNYAEQQSISMVTMLWEEGKPWRQHIQLGAIMRDNSTYAKVTML